MIKVVSIIKWICIIIGAIGTGAAAFLQYKKLNDVVEITKKPAQQLPETLEPAKVFNTNIQKGEQSIGVAGTLPKF